MLRYILVLVCLSTALAAPPAHAQQLAYQEPATPPPPAIAPLADKDCEGMDAKHCLRQEMTGCPFELADPSMGCRTIYSRDPADIEGLIGVAVCQGDDCHGLDVVETHRWKQAVIHANNRLEYEDAWHRLADDNELDAAEGAPALADAVGPAPLDITPPDGVADDTLPQGALRDDPGPPPDESPAVPTQINPRKGLQPATMYVVTNGFLEQKGDTFATLRECESQARLLLWKGKLREARCGYAPAAEADPAVTQSPTAVTLASAPAETSVPP